MSEAHLTTVLLDHSLLQKEDSTFQKQLQNTQKQIQLLVKLLPGAKEYIKLSMAVSFPLSLHACILSAVTVWNLEEISTLRSNETVIVTLK